MTLHITPLNLPGIGNERPLIIAGPCSAESEEQVMNTAAQLAAKGVRILRAGIWKPRTKPGGFEGVGAAGLPWLKRVKDELGMLTATEVATPKHVEAALEAGVDILWIGARTMANPFAVQERLNGAGITRLAVIHRGFSSYDKRIYRNPPMWHLPIELHRRIPELPILCDPSHIGGARELIAPLCQQAMDLGFNGLIVESHCSPDCALSDARQQVTPDVLNFILDKLVIRDVSHSTDSLENLRRQIDEIDNGIIELLNKRMRISREIGQYKREHAMTIVQAKR